MNMDLLAPKHVKTQQKIIMFKPVFGVGELKLYPPVTANTKRLVGVYHASDQEVKQLSYVVTEETARIIKNGTRLDLSDPMDATDWLWIKLSRGIAMSREEAMSDPDAFYYVYDEALESEKSLRYSDCVRKAMNYVGETPDTKLARVARLLDSKMDRLKPYQIREFLYRQARHDDINKVIDLIDIYEDPDADDTLFFLNLFDNGYIIDRGGVFTFEDINLGDTKEKVVAFLQNPSNKNVRNTMHRKLHPEFFDDEGNLDTTKFM